MTSTVTIDETEYMGAVTTRFVEVDVTNYDDDGNSDGESFIPADVSMRRFQAVHADVNDGTGMVASYDEDAEAIRLHYAGTDGNDLSEVTSNNNEGARVRVICMGR